GVGPVALEAVVRQDRPDLAVVVDRGRAGGLGRFVRAGRGRGQGDEEGAEGSPRRRTGACQHAGPRLRSVGGERSGGWSEANPIARPNCRRDLPDYRPGGPGLATTSCPGRTPGRWTRPEPPAVRDHRHAATGPQPGRGSAA